MYELILREIAVIDEALSIVCDRMNPADRISDASSVKLSNARRTSEKRWTNERIADLCQ